MVKIIDKINEIQPNQKYFSFEFFPPKTEIGVENLYLRMERMINLRPMFVDITWGAGASTKDLTMKISEYTQKYLGADVLMHLTLTNLRVEEIKEILIEIKQVGIQNILALRGDPEKGAPSWEPTPGGLLHSSDLVKLIRQEHGDYFCIGVAGFPEGHPQSTDHNLESDILCLKRKIDAGADFILTHFFYETSIFLEYVEKCRRSGISCPIIPGMMPIQSYSSFQKMTTYCKTRVPENIWKCLNPIREDDEAVKAYGISLCYQMCESLSQSGVNGFHFYTLNLEKSVLTILRQLGEAESIASRRYEQTDSSPQFIEINNNINNKFY